MEILGVVVGLAAKGMDTVGQFVRLMIGARGML